jgi:hypothetical protein
MQPNNLPQVQPQTVVTPSPVAVVIGGETIPTGPGPIPNQVQQQLPEVKPNTTNYAAAVFFTLLIVGFTFHLPSLLYGPVIFFCVVAGVLFFKDILATHKTTHAAADQSVVNYSSSAAVMPPKKRSGFMTLLLVVFGVIGVTVLLYVGFIILVVVMIGASGA